MPHQPDMFEPPAFSLSPAAGMTEPRLWVRRLVIWERPGSEPIRDIRLRPGLNVIWSPDGADGGDATGGMRAIGHGAGKTLFCRLLRYCLGEQRFADEIQRERIAQVFPDGVVGAEVMLDGVCWAVVRPLGVRRRHFAIAGGNVDEIAAGEGTATGIEPLVEAIEQSILTPSVASLARLQSGQKAWPIALAWLSRDQECRFDNVLDWRSPASGSDAPQPASGREIGPRRDALRAFLMAITEEEQQSRQTEEQLRAEFNTLTQELSHLEWHGARQIKALLRGLGIVDGNLPEMPLLLELLQRTADDRLADAVGLPAPDMARLGRAEKDRDEAEERLRSALEEHTTIEGSLPAERKVLTLLSAELPAFSTAAEFAGSQVCPICEVPIDRALAEGCGLSHKLHDETACRERLSSKQREVDEQSQKITRMELRSKTLLPTIALEKQRLAEGERLVEAIKAVGAAQTAAQQVAAGLKEQVARLAQTYVEKDDLGEKLRQSEDKIDHERKLLGIFRGRQQAAFGRLTQIFSAIVRRLVEKTAKGGVVLTGNGIDISIDVDGDRRTAAIDSLKVLVFDLACLCLSIEGTTRIPAFLIHDSPREADLGLSIYDELFRFIRELEGSGGVTCFQYIISTTTRPPDDVRQEPWLRLTLHGAPAYERLMRRDL